MITRQEVLYQWRKCLSIDIERHIKRGSDSSLPLFCYKIFTLGTVLFAENGRHGDKEMGRQKDKEKR